MSGRKVSKADLLELAQVLGDDLAGTEELAGESMVTIFFRCLDRARELGARAEPTPALPPLALVEAQQLEETTPAMCTACQKSQCDGTHVGCPSYLPVVDPAPDRRLNAEQWAKTRGSKGAARTA